jgi:formylglycine-generating enzyme required for sulfatase activity
MTKDEALKLALSTLDEVRQETFRLIRNGQTLYAEKKVWEAIYTIKKVLAQPEQEPVAWGVFEGNLHDMFFSPSEAQEMADLKGTHAEVRPLYTTPLQRTWVGLTYEEKHEIRYSHMTSAEFIDFIEAKLKDKNT